MRDLFRQYFTKGFGFGAGFIAVLFTAGLLAVAVSTITTFTTGTPAKASEVNANFAALKTAIEGIPNWTKSGTTAVYSDGNVTINGRISSSNLGTYCGVSSSMVTGSAGGLSAVKTICEATCSNTKAHVCTSHEMSISSQLGLLGAVPDAWYSSWSPASVNVTYVNVTDCNGFSYGGGGGTGFLPYVVAGGGFGGLDQCNTSKKIACCL